MGPDKARDLHDELLAAKPDTARHDSDICPFCTDKAQATPSDPPAAGRSDVTDTNSPNSGGRDEQSMSDEKTITVATHEALMDKAIRDATSATEKALETKTAELSAATAKITDLESASEKLTADNARLNGELDTAQVNLKTATDEVATLKSDLAAKDEAVAKSEKASERSTQVKNLGLFTEEYVTEKASVWADLADDDWAARIEEWQKLKPATDGAAGASSTDAASAMTGTTGALTDEATGDKKPSARRAALGLV